MRRPQTSQRQSASESKEDATISDVRITSEAYAPGVTPATQLIAVNGRQFTLAESTELLVKDGEFYRTYRLDYHDGDRYPHLERDAGKPDLLSEIIKPAAK